MPSTESHLAPVDVVSSETSRQRALPLLLDLAATYGLGANRHIESMLATVDALRGEPPATRGTDTRRWGPVQTSAGLWLRLDMARTRGTYTYTLLHATQQGGPWTPFLSGEHLGGQTVQDGLGSYTYSVGLQERDAQSSGSMVVEYDLRDPSRDEVLVELSDLENTGEFQDSVFWWEQSASGDLRFEYLAETDVDGDLQDEQLEVVVRLKADRSGRGDALVTDLDDRAVLYTAEQCWDASLQEVYLSSTGAALGSMGDPDACTFADEAEATNL